MAGADGELSHVHSRQLQAALGELAEQAALRLQACVESGEEIPFELDSHTGRRGAAPLYCYRPLTSAFVAERAPQLRALPAYGAAATLLDGFPGLDRYLISCGVQSRPSRGVAKDSSAVLLAFLQDVFGEQSDFHLQPARLGRALARIEGSAVSGPSEVTVLATLHGVATTGDQLRLAGGLVLYRPEVLAGIPDQARSPLGVAAPASLGSRAGEGHHLLISCTVEHPQSAEALAQGIAIVRDLLRALRLYGDGRIALGPLAWSRVGAGSWSAFATGGGGHPYGTLLVTAEQEDELRAFCNLVSLRTPQDGPMAWALRRFEMGCERADEYEALSDHLLALRSLLLADVDGDGRPQASGLLATRLAALCASPDERAALSERVLAALAFEREAIAGTAVEHAGGLALTRELASHLRALLRDAICGHLPADLTSLADELLCAEEARAEEELVEQTLGDGGEPGEVLDLAV